LVSQIAFTSCLDFLLISVPAVLKELSCFT
jgi:hypothetical protein